MTWTRRIGQLVAGGLLGWALPLGAQGLDPPPKAAVDAPPGPARDTAPPRKAAAPAPLAEPTDWAETPASSPTEDPPAKATTKASAHAETSYDAAPTEEATSDRETSRLESSGLLGGTGLLRTLSAASGAPGTFRFSLLTGFYSGSGFLCPQCPNNGQNADLQDKTSRVSGNLFLSASITDYLEAYAGVFSHSTSTNRPVDQLKQVVGDWDLGVKAFMPAERDQVFTWGGALDLGFSTGSGKVGLSGIDAVNLGVRALGTADFSKQSKDPLPVRANVNLSYFFDNSGKLVQDFEKSQGRNIDRIERFSLDINRVDFIQFGMGAEGLFDGARPFLEWSIDIPANRQGYVCDRNTVPSGDSCLRDRARFSTTPSRLSAGVRAMPWKAFPWWLEGLSLTGALEVATGGASDFLVEVAPEVPWTVWFGLGYAGDTKPKVQIQQVPAPIPPPPPVLSVHGRVVEKQTATAIAGALIHFEGRELTGLISTTDGRFVSGPLDPGQYTFRITAPGYKEGQCSVAVSEVALPVTVPPFAPGPVGEAASARAEIASPAPALPSDAPPGPARSGPRSPAVNGSGTSAGPAESQPGVSSVTCELEPVPKVSNLNGRVSDVNTGEPIAGASVKITDVLGRQLELQVDEVGAFRFENVPPGAAVISIQAPGYLRSVIRMNIEPLQELDQRFQLAPIPSKPGIRINKQLLEVNAPLVFAAGSAKPSRDALFVVQELAPFLQAHPEIAHLEIGSHTADAGPNALQVSTDRANAIRDALVLHGVAAERLTAHGYGGSEPVVPADNEAARRKNDRIVFKIVPGPAALPGAATPPGSNALPGAATLPGSANVPGSAGPGSAGPRSAVPPRATGLPGAAGLPGAVAPPAPPSAPRP